MSVLCPLSSSAKQNNEILWCLKRKKENVKKYILILRHCLMRPDKVPPPQESPPGDPIDVFDALH